MATAADRGWAARAPWIACATGIALIIAAAMVRSWALALGLAVLTAGLGLLLVLNPPLSRLSFWVFVAVLIAAIPAGNLRPPGLPGMFMAWRLLLALFLGLLAVRYVLPERQVEAPRLPVPQASACPERVTPSGPLALWLPIAGWAILSLLWSRDLGAGARYCVFLIVGVFVAFTIQRYSLQPGRLRVMLIASAAIAATTILYGVFERRTGVHLPESAILELPARYGWMITSVFHNANEFATYIALWLPVFAVVVFAGRSSRVRLSAGLVCAMGIYCLLCTGSRANIIALALGMMTLVPLMGGRRPIRVVSVVAIAALMGLYGLHAFTGVAPQHQLGALQMQGVLAEGTAARGGLLRDGLVLLANTFGAGVGAGNVEGYMGDLGHHIQNVHNWWLEILVNLGLVSFALYVWFYVAVAAGLYDTHRRASDRSLRLVAAALLAGWVGFAIGCLSSSSLVAWAPMWVYFGLCAGVIAAARAGQGQIPAQQEPSANPGHLSSLPKAD